MLHEHVDAAHRVRAHLLDELRRGDGVAAPHRGQRRDLREGARDDDRTALEDVRHRRRVARIVDEVVIRLVDQHRHALRDAVEQLLHFVLGHDHAGRVVRVAEVHEPELLGVLVGGLDQHAHVLTVVLRQRQLDRGRLDAGRVLIHRAVRRLDAEHLLRGRPERGPDDVQDFARASREEDVLGLDAVMLGELLDDVAVRIAVPVGVLPGVVHRLHHVLRRTPAVLVAREVRHRVVVIRAATHARGVAGRARTVLLREQINFTLRAEIPKGGCHTADEPTACNAHELLRLLERDDRIAAF